MRPQIALPLIAAFLMILGSVSDAGGPLRNRNYSQATAPADAPKAAPVAAADQTRGQQIAIDALPEDGHLPWLLVFTSADWRQDAGQVELLEQIASMEKLAGTARVQQYAPDHPLHRHYAIYHENDLPALVVIVPGVDGESIEAIPTLIRGSSLSLVDDLAAAIHLQAGPDDLPANELMPTANDEKGRLFRPSEPPYWFRPWLWRNGNGRSCRRPRYPYAQPFPPPAPAQPTSQPIQVRRFPSQTDTVLRDKFKELREQIKELGKQKVKDLAVAADEAKAATAKKIAAEAAKKIAAAAAASNPLMAALAPLIGLFIGGGGALVGGLRNRLTDAGAA